MSSILISGTEEKFTLGCIYIQILFYVLIGIKGYNKTFAVIRLFILIYSSDTLKSLIFEASNT
jgi:hypothetical protein